MMAGEKLPLKVTEEASGVAKVSGMQDKKQNKAKKKPTFPRD